MNKANRWKFIARRAYCVEVSKFDVRRRVRPFVRAIVGATRECCDQVRCELAPTIEYKWCAGKRCTGSRILAYMVGTGTTRCPKVVFAGACVAICNDMRDREAERERERERGFVRVQAREGGKSAPCKLSRAHKESRESRALWNCSPCRELCFVRRCERD